MDVVCRKCGVVNEYYTKKRGSHLGAYCDHCHSYIKWLPQNNPGSLTLHFGMYKGMVISDISDIRYLDWLIDKDVVKGSVREAVSKQIEKLNPKPVYCNPCPAQWVRIGGWDDSGY